MRKVFVYMLVFVLTVSFVLAADPFEVDIVDSDAYITKNETAYYYLNISNMRSLPSDFTIKFPNSDWLGRTIPLSDYNFVLPKDSNQIVKVSFTPRDYINVGAHTVPVLIKESESGTSLPINLPVQIIRTEYREYVPIVRYDIDVDYEIDPREDVIVKLDIENLNFRDIEELFITVESSLFSDERVVPLYPEERKTEEFTFSLDDFQEPMTDNIKVKVWANHNNRSYEWAESAGYKVIAYSNIEKVPAKESSLLRTAEYVTLKNNGNVDKVYEFTSDVSWFEDIFTSTEPRSSYVIHSPEGRQLAWSVELSPEEEKVIEVTTNYRPLAIIIILLIIAVVLYYVTRPPIKVKKEVSHIGTSEGGISEIKIILYVKNRVSSVVEDIIILEKVPHIANVGKDFQIGTIKPTKVIQNPKKGTLVKWELSNLEGHEERIITYKIKSKLSILGGLTLPSTIVKYSRRGRQSKTKSNRLVLEI